VEKEPILEAPGAGLPLIESLVARFFLGPIVSKRDSAQKNLERFEKTNLKILDKLKVLSQEQMHTKFLVPRLQGIEDSSRHWSATETLEHIELVGISVLGLIENLIKNQVPQGVVNVADFKPKGKYAGQDVRPAFERFTQTTLAQLKDREFSLASPKYNHPWLGPMSSLQWLWLLSSHSVIHYVQIKHILKKIT
jgi:hypothetical protein